MKAQEKNLEKRFRQTVSKMGVESLKFQSAYSTGWCDRFNLIPGGMLVFTEFKTEGKDLTPKQKARVRKALRLGFAVFIIDDEESLQYTITAVIVTITCNHEYQYLKARAFFTLPDNFK